MVDATTTELTGATNEGGLRLLYGLILKIPSIINSVQNGLADFSISFVQLGVI